MSEQIHQIDQSITSHARAALVRTNSLIRQFGGRLAGSEACRGAAESLCTDLQRVCGSASLEAFSTHPGAFTGFYRIDTVLYLIGLALLFFRQPLAAALVLLLMFIGASLEFGWYVEFYDRLYPRRTCHNVTAVLEPQGEVKQQLIFSGHHDSALELNFLKRNQKLYGLKIILPDFMRTLALTFAWVWVGWRALAGVDPEFAGAVLALLVVGVYFMFTKFFLFGKEAVPGAGDNLIASSMLVELADLLRDPTKPGCSQLAHTRLIFASFDAEESALRGSRAWVKAHRTQLDQLPTLALNIDSIYRVEDLQFLVSDLNNHIKLDRGLADQCCRIAQANGRLCCTGVMVFGGGGTDAAELMKAGVRATTMLAMSTGLVRDGLVYHTMNDTVEAIEPAAVEACLEVACGLAAAIDRG